MGSVNETLIEVRRSSCWGQCHSLVLGPGLGKSRKKLRSKPVCIHSLCFFFFFLRGVVCFGVLDRVSLCSSLS